jgi:hypothetical protein
MLRSRGEGVRAPLITWLAQQPLLTSVDLCGRLNYWLTVLARYCVSVWNQHGFGGVFYCGMVKTQLYELCLYLSGGKIQSM